MAKQVAGDRLEQARADHAEANRHIGQLEAKRADALLADRDAEAAKIDAELETQRRVVRGHRDKIGLLEAEVAREVNEMRVKEQAALIGRIEAKLTEREKVGAALADTIPQLNRLFHRMLELGREIDAGWPWPVSDRVSILLPTESVTAAIERELFRQTATAPPSGGGRGPFAGVRFPGSKAPDIRLVNQPEATTPMVEVLRSASAMASDIMRGRTPTNGHADAPPAVNGAPPDRPRTAAETKLSDLLRRQGQLAMLNTPEAEREYHNLVAEVAKISAAVEAEKGAHHG